MRHYEHNWMQVKGSQPSPVVGEECTDEPEVAVVSYENLLGHFRNGYEELCETWRCLLRKENFKEIERAYGQADDDFEFPSGLWVRTVYDFAIAYSFGRFSCDAVVDALTPLYCARTAYFVKKTEDVSSYEAEIEVERTAETFEALKDYLRYFWNKAKEEALNEAS
jgi:hypothetical protein